jgi:DNA-binding NarL/FixJ family response regulator
MHATHKAVKEGLDVLNSIDVIESGDSDCPYIYVANTVETREKLKAVGVPDDKIYLTEEGQIDLLMASIHLGASGYWGGKFHVTKIDLSIRKLRDSIEGSSLENIKKDATDLIDILETDNVEALSIVDFDKLVTT